MATPEFTLGTRRSAIVVFVLAALVRFAVQLATGAYARPTTWEYEDIAKSVLAGTGYTYFKDGTTYAASQSSPLYVMLTAGVYLFTNHSQAAMLVLQTLLGGLTAVLVAGIARRTFLSAAGWAAGGLVAVDPALAIYAAELHPLTLDALAFVIPVYFAVGLNFVPNWRRTATLGVLIGLGALTRPTILSVVPVLVWWMHRWRGIRVRSAPVLAMVTAAALVFGVWPLRNSLLLGQFVPGSSESTEWLWRGNNPQASGSSFTATGETMLQAAPREFQARIAAASEAERIGLYRDAALTFMRDRPETAISLYVSKLEAFWWGSAATGRDYPAAWTLLYDGWYVAVVFLAVVGGVGALHRTESRSVVVFIVCDVLLVSAVQAVFYVEGRHRFAVEPLLLVLSGGGLAELARSAWGRLAREPSG